MSRETQRRSLDGADLVELEARVTDLVGEFARRSLGQDQGDQHEASASGEETVDEEQDKAVRLARAAVYRHLERYTGSALVDDLTEVLLHRGADFHDLAAVLGPDHGWSDRLRERVGVAVPRGEHTVVVIEHGQPAAAPGTEADAHETDRGPWPIEAAVRAQAQYAVVTEDGAMRRVYLLQDWQETDPGRWTLAGRELTPREIHDGYDRGTLPLYVPALSLEFRLHTAAGTAAEPGARPYRFRCQCRR
ncbi:hypothetical protein [Streptomyces mirabilis]|uniref:hypothetical protein n=1 Tax=Streptomyces mirabilis TaxID=68239 RepID=UPI0033C8E84B